MSVPAPDGEFAYQWDALWLGGALIPGIARLSGDGIKRKLDVKKQKGKAGATIEDEGDEPAKFSAELLLWNGDMLAQFEEMKEDINPRKRGGKKYVLDIYHPAAAFLGIDRVYVTGISMPDHDKRQGTVKIKIDFLEWFPEPPPQKVGAGKGAGTKKGPIGSFVDDVFNGIVDGIADGSEWVVDKAKDGANAIANFFTADE